jgi:hypothetical protein
MDVKPINSINVVKHKEKFDICVSRVGGWSACYAYFANTTKDRARHLVTDIDNCESDKNCELAGNVIELRMFLDNILRQNVLGKN